MRFELAIWCLENNITRNASDQLLTILRKHHPSLPKSSKTLLNTPRSTVKMVRDMGDGKFWHYGLINSLTSKLSPDKLQNIKNQTIVIDNFADGFSPYKSKNLSVWPLAGCLCDDSEPFIISLWCGRGKEPGEANEFLEYFVNEASTLLAQGFEFKGSRYSFEIRNYIADAPARAWLRKVNQHQSAVSCERCTAVGIYRDHRMTYDPSPAAALRTDDSFMQQSQEEYHCGVSILHRLGTKMVSQFPLDPMRLLWLGVFKRFFSFLLTPKLCKFKLCSATQDEMSSMLKSFAKFCPSEFVRKPRTLKNSAMYKATEWRRILLYDWFLLLAKADTKMYRLYLLLACSIRILADPSLIEEFIDDADYLLKFFVKTSFQVLGEKFVVYNVHHLEHIASDCKLHGALEEFSAFKYENSLGSLKLLLHAPGKPLSQIICRIMERAATLPGRKKECGVTFSGPHTDGPVLETNSAAEQFKRATLKDMTIAAATAHDSCFLLKDKEIVIIQNIVKYEEHINVIGRAFQERSAYFTYPFSSTQLDISVVKNLGPLRTWHLDQIDKKCYLLPMHPELMISVSSSNFKGLVLPLLHVHSEH